MTISYEQFTEVSGKLTILKDPNSVLDYDYLWGDWLTAVADSISTQTCVVVSDVGAGGTVDSSMIVGNNVKMWLSGGTAGETVAVRNRIVTAGGRTEDKTLYFKIKEH